MSLFEQIDVDMLLGGNGRETPLTDSGHVNATAAS